MSGWEAVRKAQHGPVKMGLVAKFRVAGAGVRLLNIVNQKC